MKLRLQPPTIRKKSSDSERILLFLQSTEGDLSEWLKEHAWKACKRETVSRVRIPQSPLIVLQIKCKTLQYTHCQCFAFFVDAKQSIRKQVFLVKSDTRKIIFQRYITLAVFCTLLHHLNCCTLRNLQTSKN